MRRSLAVLACALVLLASLGPPAVSAAVPPPNDAFASALVVTFDAPYATSANLALATFETGESALSCGGPDSLASHSVWYRYVAPATGTVVAAITSATTDWRLATYTWDGTAGWAGFTRAGCRFGNPTGDTSTVRVSTGTTYYLQVADMGSGGGPFDLAFTFYAPPANDMLAGARTVGAMPWTDVVPLWAATVETGEPNPCDIIWTANRRSVWYSLIAPADGELSITTAGDYFTEIMVVVYPDGAGWGGLGAGMCGTVSPSTFAVQAGQRYRVQVVDFASWGTLTIGFSFAEYGPPPNDAFADATGLSAPFFVAEVDTTRATTEPSEPVGCGATRTVWFSYRAEADGIMTVDPTGPGSSHAAVTPYRQDGSGVGGLSALACAVDGGSITVSLAAGTTYYLQVGDLGWQASAFDLEVAIGPVPPVPANDAFANAAPIGSLPYEGSVETRGATTETGEAMGCGWGQSVWYRLDATADASLLASVAAPTFLDATVAVYRSDGDGLGGLTELGCSYGGVQPFLVEAGRTYYVRSAATYSGGGGLTIRLERQPGDMFADAKSVSLPTFSDTVDNRYATTEAGEPQDCSASLWRTHWYKVTPPATGTVTVDPAGSAIYDTDLAVYQATGAGLGGLTYITCRYHDPVTFEVAAGATYYIQVYDAYMGGGMIRLQFTFAPTPDRTPPTLWLPAEIQAEATGQNGAAVAYAASANDAIDGVVPIFCSPGSGSTFGLGETSVSCWARDAAGNRALGSFQVQVRDTTAPEVTISGAEPSYAVDGRIELVTVATDAVATAPVIDCELTAPSGAVVPAPCTYGVDAWTLQALGSYTFSATGTDASGNRARASTTFTVAASYASMINLTGSWTGKAAVAKDLVAILGSAYAAEQRGQFTAEARKLVEYRSAVKAQMGKAIDAEKAALLIAFAYGL